MNRSNTALLRGTLNTAVVYFSVLESCGHAKSCCNIRCCTCHGPGTGGKAHGTCALSQRERATTAQQARSSSEGGTRPRAADGVIHLMRDIHVLPKTWAFMRSVVVLEKGGRRL
jgi:hypothetical protein